MLGITKLFVGQGGVGIKHLSILTGRVAMRRRMTAVLDHARGNRLIYLSLLEELGTFGRHLVFEPHHATALLAS